MIDYYSPAFYNSLPLSVKKACAVEDVAVFLETPTEPLRELLTKDKNSDEFISGRRFNAKYQDAIYFKL